MAMEKSDEFNTHANKAADDEKCLTLQPADDCLSRYRSLSQPTPSELSFASNTVHAESEAPKACDATCKALLSDQKLTLPRKDLFAAPTNDSGPAPGFGPS